MRCFLLITASIKQTGYPNTRRKACGMVTKGRNQVKQAGLEIVRDQPVVIFPVLQQTFVFQDWHGSVANGGDLGKGLGKVIPGFVHNVGMNHYHGSVNAFFHF